MVPFPKLGVDQPQSHFTQLRHFLNGLNGQLSVPQASSHSGWKVIAEWLKYDSPDISPTHASPPSHWSSCLL